MNTIAIKQNLRLAITVLNEIEVGDSPEREKRLRLVASALVTGASRMLKPLTGEYVDVEEELSELCPNLIR